MERISPIGLCTHPRRLATIQRRWMSSLVEARDQYEIPRDAFRGKS
jgi:hypothetical protein